METAERIWLIWKIIIVVVVYFWNLRTSYDLSKEKETTLYLIDDDLRLRYHFWFFSCGFFWSLILILFIREE